MLQVLSSEKGSIGEWAMLREKNLMRRKKQGPELAGMGNPDTKFTFSLKDCF